MDDRKILFIDTCISQRGGQSRTAALCRSFLEPFGRLAPDCTIETVRPAELDLRPFDVPMLEARDEAFRSGRFTDPVYRSAVQFREADGIVVGAPFWDLTFPAVLRTYIEHISANGVTYYYDERGPHGCCRAGWLVYLTSGGDFEREESLGCLYWKQLAAMYGIPEYHSIFAGGLDAVPDQAAAILAGACAEAEALAGRLAVSGRAAAGAEL